MALELYMVGLVVRDMEKSLEFYRRLGLAVPAEGNGQSQHVEVKMKSGVTFFLNASARLGQESIAATGDHHVIFEFYLASRAEVEEKYKELTEAGYRSFRAPYVTPFDMYFAMVDDPDGNIILLSASAS